ncbi:hypothetical protein AC578_3378 [Pseudocercospora eumusae]|uniref:Cutinase n=1 Tax=Pseudocercospora eumusae TaxID=321146 RepID=A0A139GV39_9PEZI|nr:hypothetical protein AC578_3378 [Pseudocercospora eumusae]
MHSFMTLWLLAAAVNAAPAQKRQLSGLSSTSNELQSGDCKAVTFIFARGSTEPGNMGSTVGPATCSALKKKYGNDQVACQGVGGAYLGDLGSNALPDGTTSAALQESTKMFNLANSQCPDTKVVAGGYSQGAAVMAGSVGKLDSAVMAQVKGVVLYGYTKNLQNKGQIPGYPKEQTKVFCNASDGVCSGTLVVTAGKQYYPPVSKLVYLANISKDTLLTTPMLRMLLPSWKSKSEQHSLQMV